MSQDEPPAYPSARQVHEQKIAEVIYEWLRNHPDALVAGAPGVGLTILSGEFDIMSLAAEVAQTRLI